MARMRIFYLPIIEPGAFHDVALQYKRGLYDALRDVGHTVLQYDYLARHQQGHMVEELPLLAGDFEPDIMLTQLHSADVITKQMLSDLRAAHPDMWIINWSGDSWVHSLTSDVMLDMLTQVDLQLVASPNVLPTYATHYIPAAFWQIAYEYPNMDILPQVPCYDVVFLANVISDKRRETMEFLRSLDDVNVGIYGDWQHANGHNTYNFAEGEALYKNAKVAIADNTYPDTQNYISNRPFQVLGAGGAVLCHQYVPNMWELSGLMPDTHFLEWQTFDELEALIRDVLADPTRHREMVETGQQFALTYHTYEARVSELFDVLIPKHIG